MEAKDREAIDPSESPSYWAGYWHQATIAREEEIAELKEEVRELRVRIDVLRDA